MKGKYYRTTKGGHKMSTLYLYSIISTEFVFMSQFSNLFLLSIICLITPLSIAQTYHDRVIVGLQKPRDTIIAVDGDYIYWKDDFDKTVRRGLVQKRNNVPPELRESLHYELVVDQEYWSNHSDPNHTKVFDFAFAAYDGMIYWQSGSQIGRATLSNGKVNIDPSYVTNSFTINGYAFDVDELYIYWKEWAQDFNSGFIVRRGEISINALEIDPDFWGGNFHPSDNIFAVSNDMVYWQNSNTVRRALLINGVINIDQRFSYNSLNENLRLVEATGNIIHMEYSNSNDIFNSYERGEIELLEIPEFDEDIMTYILNWNVY